MTQETENCSICPRKSWWKSKMEDIKEMSVEVLDVEPVSDEEVPVQIISYLIFF
jgi:hypothetical protein